MTIFAIATEPPPGSFFETYDFDSYSLLIDARSPHEYADDHIPGAVNLPVVDDVQFAEVGKAYKASPHEAYVVGAQFALRNIADHVTAFISSYPSDARFLVYCYRGGKRSRAWAEPLRGIGYQTDVLPGGWKAYRAAVREALESLSLRLMFRVIGGPTGCGKTRLLQALRRGGQQVLDIEGLANHKGSLLGLLPGEQQPTQKLFDSLLVQEMRRLDPSKPRAVQR
jgi:tRNA 2-selenouridine synthase